MNTCRCAMCRRSPAGFTGAFLMARCLIFFFSTCAATAVKAMTSKGRKNISWVRCNWHGSIAAASGDRAGLGLAAELADLLRFLKRAGIRNTVWLTADLHYTAAHYFDPNGA